MEEQQRNESVRPASPEIVEEEAIKRKETGTTVQHHHQLNRRPSLRVEIPAKMDIGPSSNPSTNISRSSSKPPVTPATRKAERSTSIPKNGARQILRMLTPRSGRSSSFPARMSEADLEALVANSAKANSPSQKMARSRSGPVELKPGQSIRKSKSLNRMNSGTIRVKPATPRPAAAPPEQSEATLQDEDNGEDIPEDEAVCRICMDELGEESKTLKMECSCKGELALAHEECALKWFGMKGTRKCDVCGHEVQNLPVTLTRLQNAPELRGSSVAIQQQLVTENALRRVWHDIPVLVMISMLAYFCLLEQLLVKRRGPRALIVALPFSILFGMLTSISASTLVERRYLWCFAVLQAGMIILFAHVFYSWMHLNAVLGVAMAGFAGFGISLSMHAIVLECWRCRNRRVRNSAAAEPTADIESGQQPIVL